MIPELPAIKWLLDETMAKSMQQLVGSLRGLGHPKHCWNGQWSGTGGVNKGNVEELLQSHGKSLSNYELPELAEQHIWSEITASDAEEETPVRELSTEFLINSITMIMQITDQIRTLIMSRDL
jgi:hypothetical protein